MHTKTNGTNRVSTPSLSVQSSKSKNRGHLRIAPLFGLALMVLGGFFLIVGCAATGPSAFERAFFQPVTNFVEKVTYRTNDVFTTNIVPRVEVQTVLITNEQHVIVPVFSTNTVEREVVVTNHVAMPAETNLVPLVTLTNGVGSTVTTGIIGAVAGAFGFGDLAKIATTGLLTGFLTWRNRQFAVNNAVQTASVAQTVAKTFSQQIETLQQVIARTPQGATLAPLITNFLVSHQREVGVLSEATQIVDENVSDADAKSAAEKILETLRQLQSPTTAPTKV